MLWAFAAFDHSRIRLGPTLQIPPWRLCWCGAQGRSDCSLSIVLCARRWQQAEPHVNSQPGCGGSAVPPPATQTPAFVLGPTARSSPPVACEFRPRRQVLSSLRATTCCCGRSACAALCAPKRTKTEETVFSLFFFCSFVAPGKDATGDAQRPYFAQH